MYLKILKEVEEAEVGVDYKYLGGVLRRRLTRTLDRVEELKCPKNIHNEISLKSNNNVNTTIIYLLSGLFMPWSDEDVVKTVFMTKKLWKDKDGMLKLSEAQKKRFYKWARPLD